MVTAELEERDEKNDRDERDYVHSLARGLAVIRTFDRNHVQMTPSEVAERTDLSRATARRLLLTLVREGYAETDGKWFRLRSQVLELGYSALASLSFAELATPTMQDLSNAVEETCLAVVLDGYDVVYVAKTTSQRLVNVSIEVGSRIPAFCVSSGRVLLAALTDDALDRYLEGVEPTRFTDATVTAKPDLRAIMLGVREAGWSIVDQEYELGFRSLSVPIRDRGGKVVAALNVCCPSPRVSVEKHAGALPARGARRRGRDRLADSRGLRAHARSGARERPALRVGQKGALRSSARSANILASAPGVWAAGATDAMRAVPLEEMSDMLSPLYACPSLA